MDKEQVRVASLGLALSYLSSKVFQFYQWFELADMIGSYIETGLWPKEADDQKYGKEEESDQESPNETV